MTMISMHSGAAEPAAPEAYTVRADRRRTLRIAATRLLTEPGSTAPVREFTLVPVDGQPLVPFPSGAHLALERLADDEEPARANTYSLVNDGTAPREYVIAVRRSGAGAFSDWLHDRARVGDEFEASAPVSAFRLDLRAKHHLLIAAGIGITPILAHARAARLWGASLRVVYGFSGESGPYLDELRALAGDEVRVVRGREALAQAVREELAAAPYGAFAYACGPESFLRTYTQTGLALGWPEERLRREFFALAPQEPGDPFEVRLARRDMRLTVPSGTSLLERLEAERIAPPSLCHQGVCGQCVLPVCSGEVIHRDVILTPEQRARTTEMYPCVSRGVGDSLVLDY